MIDESKEKTPSYYKDKLQNLKESVFKLHRSFKLLLVLIIVAVSIFGIYLAIYERNDIVGLFIFIIGSGLLLIYVSFLSSKIRKLYADIVITEEPFTIRTENLDKMSYFKYPSARKMSGEIKELGFATEETLEEFNSHINRATILNGFEIAIALIVGLWFLFTVISERMNWVSK